MAARTFKQTTKINAKKIGPNKSKPRNSRRDFLTMTGATLGAYGAYSLLKPFISSMNPSADVLAEASLEVDLQNIPPGQAKTVMWRGKPVFIRHRTEEEVARAREEDAAPLPDPQKDEERIKKPEWLVVVGICTHLGCVPLGQKPTDQRGDYKGWFCPCHGSAYDLSGRVRQGPAPTNLEVPPYEFLSDTKILIG